MQENSIQKQIWQILYPYFVYMVLSVVVPLAGMLPAGIRIFADSGRISYEQIISCFYDHAMLITLISNIIYIPTFYLFFCSDKRRESEQYEALNRKYYFYIPVFGFFACLALNNLIDLIGIINWDIFYKGISEYSEGEGFWMVFLASVIVAPVSEELLFRGLLYKRMKSLWSPLKAGIFSSVAFGVTHGNFVQFLYAFLAGMLLAFIYEKYKNLAAPILFHFIANLTSVLWGTLFQTEVKIFLKIIVFIAETIVLCLLYKVINEKVTRKKQPHRVEA